MIKTKVMGKQTLLILLIIIGHGGPTFHRLGPQTLSFENAKSRCPPNQRLPKFESVEDFEEFVVYTSNYSKGHHSFWLNITRKVLFTWTWVNGSEQFYRPLEDEDKAKCGLIDYTSPHLRTARCSSLWLGALCHRKGTAHCPDLNVGVKQLKIGTTCIRVLMEKMNWYEARWRCQEDDMDLVIINTYKEAEELKDKLRKNFKIFSLSHFWIGFRGTDWVYHDTEQAVKAVFWDRKEPKTGNDCVVVHVKGEDHYWRTTDCKKKHRVICQDIPYTITQQHQIELEKDSFEAVTSIVHKKDSVGLSLSESVSSATQSVAELWVLPGLCIVAYTSNWFL